MRILIKAKGQAPSINTHCFHRINISATKMKFRSHVVSASALFGWALPLEAWSPVSRQVSSRMHQNRWLSISPTSKTPAPRTSSPTFSLQASVMAEGETDLSRASGECTDSPTETTMARGSVVCFFRGGLAAVRIDEDSLDKSDEGSPNVLSPAEIPDTKKEASLDAGT